MTRVHVFNSEDRLFGFTFNELGTNLPRQYGPWAKFKTIELSHDEAYPGVDVDVCFDDIRKYGFHLTSAHKRITDSVVMKQRALVLGGGGAVGNAWLIGIAAGLFEAGVDVAEADLIVGTSAGATAAAQITSAPATRLLDEILFDTAREETGAISSNVATLSVGPGNDHMERTNRIIAAAADAADMRRKMGAAARSMDAASDSSAQTRWRAAVAARLPSKQWPQQRVLFTAVDARSGESVVLDSDSGVDLADAVAASCSGSFAYTIGDHQYIDGGYGADVNADLTAGYGRVLVIPPLGDKTRKPLKWGLHLAAQVEDLRAGGSRVEVISPDGDSQEALGFGMKLMDLSMRRRAAQSGYDQGKAVAKNLTSFWH